MANSAQSPLNPAAMVEPEIPTEAGSPLLPPVARFFGVPFQKGLAKEISAIHLCPSRVHLATIRDGLELEVCNRLTLRTLKLGGCAQARLVAFRPLACDEKSIELAIVGPLEKGEITRWDLTGDRPLPPLSFAGTTAFAYSGDGRFAAAGGHDGRIQAWHLGPTGPVPVLEATTDAPVECLIFHPEHPTVYATLASGNLVALELAPSPAAAVVEALRNRAPEALFHQLAVGPHGYSLYLAGWDESVYVVDTATGEVGAFDPGVGPILSLQVLPASGNLCVLGHHSVYLAKAVGPAETGHLALVCPFQESLYAAWELDGDAVLIFHAAQALGS